jgi:hypothetical protein
MTNEAYKILACLFINAVNECAGQHIHSQLEHSVPEN